MENTWEASYQRFFNGAGGGPPGALGGLLGGPRVGPRLTEEFELDFMNAFDLMDGMPFLGGGRAGLFAPGLFGIP